MSAGDRDIFERLDKSRPEPLWHQAETAIRARILSRQWPVGMQIPAEDRLCELLGVSRITLRHAMRNLEESGLLQREHGRGTFVRSARMVAGVRGLTSFTDEMKALGLDTGAKLLRADEAPASAAVAEALEIKEGEPIARIRRLRLGGGQPIGIQQAHLRLDRVPGLLAEDISGASLYQLLAIRYGIRPQVAQEVYRVGPTPAADASLLSVAKNAPAFIVERTTRDERGPFEFTVSTMRGDRYEIRSTLRSL